MALVEPSDVSSGEVIYATLWNTQKGLLFDAIGNQVYTEGNYIATDDSVTTSLDALDMEIKDIADEVYTFNGAKTFNDVVTLTNTGLHILDTNASHDLIIKPGSDLTVDRTLTLTTGDNDRTLTLSGNPTLGDWFDQAVKTTSNPTFNNITVTGTVDGVDIEGLQTSVTVLQGDINGFPDELKNLVTAEIQQLEAIGATTISATQWGYVGALDQGLATTSSVGFAQVTVDNILINLNTISTTAGNLNIIPVDGSSVVIDNGASFDGSVLTGLTALTSTAITGTLQTAAQANITSLGTIAALRTSGNVGIGTTSNVNASMTLAGGSTIGVNTVDGSDNSSLFLSGSGLNDETRGAFIALYGVDGAGTGHIEINAGSVTGGDIYFRTGSVNKGRVYNTGGLVWGNPTGGNKGLGTINAVSVYDDNVLLTDFVFDKYIDGKVKDGDEDFHYLDSRETWNFVTKKRHLPTIVGRKKWEKNGKYSTGQLINMLWKTVEVQQIHIHEQDTRIAQLERNFN